MNIFFRIHREWTFVLLLTSVLAHAQTMPPQAVPQLAADPAWIRLGHYEPAAHSNSGWRSAIHAGDFFLHPNGSTDPAAELQATLLALNAAPDSDTNKHAQCRFPARLLWLKSQAATSGEFRSDIRCPAFDDWTQAGGVESISVVFATGSLGNPATYFGHTLLKFNFREGDTHTNLLDVSVNYGAIVEGKKDNQITYLFKSLTGGYDAGFSHIHYYYHDHNYGDHELRDLWEYELDLPQREVALIVAHAWEVLSKRYTYYFFQGNCAYQMGKVLDVVPGIHVTPEDRPWTIPQALVRQLASSQYLGRPLVSSVNYYPSRQSRFYEKYLSLSPDEITEFKSLASKKSSLGEPGFKTRSLPSQQAILDTLIDYERYVHNPIADAAPEVKQDYATVLSMRYALPPGVPGVTRRVPPSPDLGRPSGWVQFGIGRNTQLGNAVSLQLRPAYYDPLDADSGHVRNGSLAMGDFRAELFSDRLRINWLDLIHIQSTNPAISQLPGDSGAAWNLRLGAEQARLWCGDCLVARAQGDIGYGRQVTAGTFVAAYLGGALQNDRIDQGFGYLRGSAALIASPLPSLSLKLGYEYRVPLTTRVSNYAVINIAGRYALGPRMDLRIQYEKDQAEHVNFGVGAYW